MTTSQLPSLSASTKRDTLYESLYYEDYEPEKEAYVLESATRSKKYLTLLLSISAAVLVAVGLGGGYFYVRKRELIQTNQVAGGSSSTSGSPMFISGSSTLAAVSTGNGTNFTGPTATDQNSSTQIPVDFLGATSMLASGSIVPTQVAPLSTPAKVSVSTSSKSKASSPLAANTEDLQYISPSAAIPSPKTQAHADKPFPTSARPTPPISPISSISPESTPAPTPPVQNTGNSYLSKTYSGVATHFPGSPSSSSPLACGDSYTAPSTTLFAALCHSEFDSYPGTSATDLINENKSPACGTYVAGRKGLDGNWISGKKGNGKDWVVVGGDGAFSCVGTEGVRCHIPLTISVTYQSQTISGIMVVDRNQGLAPSPCSVGDVDLSDLAYRTLAGTTSSDVNTGLGSELKGVTWVWET